VVRMETTEVDRQEHAAELKAIEEIVATVEHATQNELVDEFLSLFRSDAIWTTGGGKRLLGLEEIAGFTRRVLPGGMKGLALTMEMTHVLFIRADVAAVKVRQIYTRDDGQPSEDFGEGTPLFVMSREDGRWLLVACQNTGVLADY
jgi:uncharacterized protein (TIGR02246 family)